MKETQWILHNDYESILARIDQYYSEYSDSEEVITDYFNTNKDEYKPAIELIQEIMNNNQSILISGDSDVDGITATAILYKSLNDIYNNVKWFVPDRHTHGFGIDVNTVREMLPDGGLVITVDTGITEVSDVKVLRELGYKVIITDHHLPETENLPIPDVMIDPKLWSADGTTEYLASGGLVATKLAYLVKKSKTNETALDPFVMQLVALGILSDVIELDDTIKTILNYGLVCLQNTDHPGLKALFSLCGTIEESPITSYVLSFNVIPKLNAAGRMGQPQLGVELLLVSLLADGTAQEKGRYLAHALVELNSNRKAVEGMVYDEAVQQAWTYTNTHVNTLVVYQPGWHPGVLGIIAARLVEQFHRPTIALTKKNDLLIGSGRSVENFSLYQALEDCDDTVLEFGGHAAAAGVTIEEKRYSEFCKTFEEVVSSHGLPLTKKFHCNKLVTVEECQSVEFILSLLAKEPIGNKNPEWYFILEPVIPVFIGSKGSALTLIVEKDNLSLQLKQFRPHVRYEQFIGVPTQFVITPSFNYFGGITGVEWNIRDVKEQTKAQEDIYVENA